MFSRRFIETVNWWDLFVRWTFNNKYWDQRERGFQGIQFEPLWWSDNFLGKTSQMWKDQTKRLVPSQKSSIYPMPSLKGDFCILWILWLYGLALGSDFPFDLLWSAQPYTVWVEQKKSKVCWCTVSTVPVSNCILHTSVCLCAAQSDPSTFNDLILAVCADLSRKSNNEIYYESALPFSSFKFWDLFQVHDCLTCQL